MDAKGRVAVPMRYRQRLIDEARGELVLTIDTEQRCLLVYPLPIWEEIERKISALPSFHSATRRIQRLLIGHATEVTLDSHGRMLLPTVLRDYAHIDKRIMLVGQGNKFELWSEEHWQKCREDWIGNDLITQDDLPEELKTISL